MSMMNPGGGRPMATALRPPGRPPIRRNGPPQRPLAELAAGIPGAEPSPIGRTFGGERTGPAIPAPPGQGADMMAEMRQALARAIAVRQKGVRRG
jgi:hypothetical protein